MSYDIFSSYYDELTFNVNYEKRADYLESILTRLGRSFGSSLDLACGTGSLALILKKRGIDIMGSDMSCDMLSVASMKAYEENLQILFINQRMQDLELPYMIDTCICTLDAINHVTDINDVQRIFDRVYRFLSHDGVFIFDVNTIYKHDNILSDNVFTYDVDDVYLTWENTLEKDHTVNIKLIFDDRNGNIETEEFLERAYDLDDIKAMLEKSGFEHIDVYNDLTFNPVGEKSEKAVFVAGKGF